MRIEIYGPGCPRCQNTEQVVKEALKELGLDAQVEKISDLEQIIDKGIIKTPAIIIDGKKVLEGKVPTVDEMKAILK